MKKILVAIMLLSPVVFYSCKSGGGDPKAVLNQFFDALNKKDFDGAKKYATEDSKQLLDFMQMGANMNKDKNDSKKGEFDKSKMEIGDAKIDGDKATIPVKHTETNETINFTLKKEKGEWKVAFDKATLMGEAMDKASEKGVNIADSVNKAVDELKNVNMDSLKTKMNEGMKVLDSVNKELKKVDNK